jgi:hypothetical protein
MYFDDTPQPDIPDSYEKLVAMLDDSNSGTVKRDRPKRPFLGRQPEPKAGDRS